MKLPTQCPNCGEPLGGLHFSQTRPHELSRRLQVLAVALVPVTATAVLILLGLHRLPLGFGFSHPLMITGYIIIPGFFVYFLSLLPPHVRTVSCHSCGWYADFRVRRWW